MVDNRFRIVFFLAASAAVLVKASPVLAICPVCTVAVGAGVGLAQYFGIDDSITGIWVGGLVVSMAAWTIDWLNRKNIKFYGRKILVVVSYYALVVTPLYWKELIGHPFNKIWGMDKLMFGIAFGSILFLSGALAHFRLKKRNGEKSYFPFQKVVLAISPLIVFSAVFYFITR